MTTPFMVRAVTSEGSLVRLSTTPVRTLNKLDDSLKHVITSLRLEGSAGSLVSSSITVLTSDGRFSTSPSKVLESRVKRDP